MAATTSNMLTQPKLFSTRLTPTQMSPPSSLEQYFQSRRRSRCTSCSDASFDDSSFLLEDTLLPRRSRTCSVSERIKSEVQTGSITYFCRSRGHGFIRGDDGEDHFVHVSDVESEFVPMKGDTVSYRLCPIPPKFDKYQAVNVQLIKMISSSHRRWDSPQSPEDLEQDELETYLPAGDV